jgi:DNA-3-methyladenine glycosylase II
MQHIIHLKKDKKLAKLIAKQPNYELEKRRHIHFQLCKAIMSQQLSTTVAAVFQKRFLDLFKGKIPTPQQIAETPFETLRSIGLSNAKAQYTKNVAAFFIENKLTDSLLHKMDNDAVIDLLIQIKGVGKWTVQMILMFSMQRTNVFAPDDLSIQQAMCKLYNIDNTEKKQMKIAMHEIAKKWEPYQTYACRYLWGMID